jgi:hypothetical protein
MLALCAVSASSCKKKPAACEGLRAVSEVVTLAEAKKLGAPTQFVDEGLRSEESNWSGHGAKSRRGRLGPLKVDYGTTEYKGHSITTGTTIDLFDPACPTSRVELRLGLAIDRLFLWHDVAHSRYIVDPSDGRLYVFRSGSLRPGPAGSAP